MEMRGRGRGRGFRGGRGRGMLRNIKHQSHCKELERIRERGREMREKKQAGWEERKRVRLEREKELREGGGGGHEKLGDGGVSERLGVEEESSSEDEGWCEGVPAFRGTLSVVVLEADKVLEDTLISDDEDHENVEEVEQIDNNAVIQKRAGGGEFDEGLLHNRLSDSEKSRRESVYEERQDVLNKNASIQKILEKDVHLSAENGSAAEDIKSGNESSSDEAPEEIKIVKSYENEDPCDADTQLKSKTPDSNERPKPSRKRKRKTGKSGTSNEPAEPLATDDNRSEPSKEKLEPKAKVTRQSVLEQRIRPPTLLERLLLQVDKLLRVFFTSKTHTCTSSPGDQEGEKHHPAVC